MHQSSSSLKYSLSRRSLCLKNIVISQISILTEISSRRCIQRRQSFTANVFKYFTAAVQNNLVSMKIEKKNPRREVDLYSLKNIYVLAQGKLAKMWRTAGQKCPNNSKETQETLQCTIQQTAFQLCLTSDSGDLRKDKILPPYNQDAE